MKHKTFFILIIIFYSFDLIGQDYKRVDSIINIYSKSISKPEILANKINLDFNDYSDKARAIYTWIARNISYDVDSYYSKSKSDAYVYENKEEKIIKELKLQNKVAKRTIKKKLAVCYGYSVLFKKLCDLCNIQCVIITGGAKTKIAQIGKMPSISGHAWNAIKINEKWELIDVTWGAGYVDDKRRIFVQSFTDKYFLTYPDKFFLNHFPKDSVWINSNKTKKDFVRLPLFYTDYLVSGVDIIHPLDGELEIKENDSIDFKIAKFNCSHSISYIFSNDRYSHLIEPKSVEQDFYEFKIMNSLSKNGYLTIYLDSKAIISYKINIKNTSANIGSYKMRVTAGLQVQCFLIIFV